ncbi:hypothetical protein K438DRAFT_1783088 [Mycena galopus ATCC 62051]|nr:hypothetical protein K438DRAFT_1783088 [Mycena galopus ATCC 62051]
MINADINAVRVLARGLSPHSGTARMRGRQSRRHHRPQQRQPKGRDTGGLERLGAEEGCVGVVDYREGGDGEYQCSQHYSWEIGERGKGTRQEREKGGGRGDAGRRTKQGRVIKGRDGREKEKKEQKRTFPKDADQNNVRVGEDMDHVEVLFSTSPGCTPKIEDDKSTAGRCVRNVQKWHEGRVGAGAALGIGLPYLPVAAATLASSTSTRSCQRQRGTCLRLESTFSSADSRRAPRRRALKGRRRAQQPWSAWMRERDGRAPGLPAALLIRSATFDRTPTDPLHLAALGLCCDAAAGAGSRVSTGGVGADGVYIPVRVPHCTWVAASCIRAVSKLAALVGACGGQGLPEETDDAEGAKPQLTEVARMRGRGFLEQHVRKPATGDGSEETGSAARQRCKSGTSLGERNERGGLGEGFDGEKSRTKLASSSSEYVGVEKEVYALASPESDALPGPEDVGADAWSYSYPDALADVEELRERRSFCPKFAEIAGRPAQVIFHVPPPKTANECLCCVEASLSGGGGRERQGGCRLVPRAQIRALLTIEDDYIRYLAEGPGWVYWTGQVDSQGQLIIKWGVTVCLPRRQLEYDGCGVGRTQLWFMAFRVKRRLLAGGSLEEIENIARGALVLAKEPEIISISDFNKKNHSTAQAIAILTSCLWIDAFPGDLLSRMQECCHKHKVAWAYTIVSR